MRLPIITGYRHISLNIDHTVMTGHASIRFDRDMTPWFWSYENSGGVWSMSVHIPWAQLHIVGPFRFVMAKEAS